MSNLLYQLDHADAVSLVEGDGAAQTIELAGEPEGRQTLRVSIDASSGSVAKRLPRALRRVQGVQGDAAWRKVKLFTSHFITTREKKKASF